MAQLMILAHLIGDYLLQGNLIARWKARSLWGVLAHGAIVTIASLACTLPLAPDWWPYALLIGVVHTAIDVVRARLLHIRQPGQELFWYLLDQAAHLTVIVLVVTWSDGWRIAPTRFQAIEKLLILSIGYILLAQPTWVLLRMVVRGVWGVDAAPPLGTGSKYGPIVERLLIATCVLTGQFYLVPLVLVPRRVLPIRLAGLGVGVVVRSTDHWAETLLSVLLALGIGLALRMM